jgi:hypothetical protein
LGHKTVIDWIIVKAFAGEDNWGKLGGFFGD